MACFLSAILVSFLTYEPVKGDSQKTFIGSEACGECHDQAYEQFNKYAKKTHSYESVKKMAKGLTPAEFEECLTCHTTGYGQPGGFKSEAETPHLKDAGCEVCHGPGSVHAETEETEDIKTKLSAKDCEVCHNPERVAAFNYKPLIYGGAH